MSGITPLQLFANIGHDPDTIEDLIWHNQYILFKGWSEVMLSKVDEIEKKTQFDNTKKLASAYMLLTDYYKIRGENAKDDFMETGESLLSYLDLNGIHTVTKFILLNQAGLCIRNAGDNYAAQDHLSHALALERRVASSSTVQNDIYQYQSRVQGMLAVQYIGFTAFNLARNINFSMKDEKRMTLFDESINAMDAFLGYAHHLYEDPENTAKELGMRKLEFLISYFDDLKVKYGEAFRDHALEVANAFDMVTKGERDLFRRNFLAYSLQLDELLGSYVNDPFEVAAEVLDIHRSLDTATPFLGAHKRIVMKYTQ